MGGTARRFDHEIAVAKYCTEELHQSTDDLDARSTTNRHRGGAREMPRARPGR